MLKSVSACNIEMLGMGLWTRLVNTTFNVQMEGSRHTIIIAQERQLIVSRMVDLFSAVSSLSCDPSEYHALAANVKQLSML